MALNFGKLLKKKGAGVGAGPAAGAPPMDMAASPEAMPGMGALMGGPGGAPKPKSKPRRGKSKKY